MWFGWYHPDLKLNFFFRIFSFRNVQFFVRIKNNLDSFFINIFIFKISKLDFNSIMAESNFAVAKHTHTQIHKMQKCTFPFMWLNFYHIIFYPSFSLPLSIFLCVRFNYFFFIRFFSQTDFLWIHKHEHESNFEWK